MATAPGSVWIASELGSEPGSPKESIIPQKLEPDEGRERWLGAAYAIPHTPTPLLLPDGHRVTELVSYRVLVVTSEVPRKRGVPNNSGFPSICPLPQIFLHLTKPTLLIGYNGEADKKSCRASIVTQVFSRLCTSPPNVYNTFRVQPTPSPNLSLVFVRL
jgi:hypothetical protein